MADNPLFNFDYSLLTRPEVRAWALWLISTRENQLKQQGPQTKTMEDLFVDLRGGVNDPQAFYEEQAGHGVAMRAAFGTLYREVIESGGAGLALERQPFFTPGIFRPHQPHLGTKANLPEVVPGPSDEFELFRAYPDIERSFANLQMRLGKLLSDARIVEESLRQYLKGFVELFDELRAEEGLDVSELRGELDEIAARIELIESLFSRNSRETIGAVVRITEMFFINRPRIPAGSGREELDDRYRKMTGGGGERSVDDAMRIAAAHLFVGIETALDALAEEEEGAPVAAAVDAGSDETMPSPRSFPERIAAGEDPLALLRDLDGLNLNPAAAGAEILLGAFRRRLGEDSPPMAVIDPIIRRLAWSDQAPAGFASEDPAERSHRHDDLPRLVLQMRESGQPVIVEFGSGPVASGLWLARQNPDAIVFSADPQIPAAHWTAVTEGALPPNFHSLPVRAEEMALFAAAGAFADRVVAIAPGSTQLPAMLLSAVLMVRAGGRISIFLGEQDDIPAELLLQLGLPWTGTVITPRDGSRPPSQTLMGKPMRRLEITGGGPFHTRPLPTGTDGRPAFGGLTVIDGETRPAADPGPDDPSDGTNDISSLAAGTFESSSAAFIAVPLPAAAAAVR